MRLKRGFRLAIVLRSNSLTLASNESEWIIPLPVSCQLDANKPAETSQRRSWTRSRTRREEKPTTVSTWTGDQFDCFLPNWFIFYLLFSLFYLLSAFPVELKLANNQPESGTLLFDCATMFENKSWAQVLSCGGRSEAWTMLRCGAMIDSLGSVENAISHTRWALQVGQLELFVRWWNNSSSCCCCCRLVRDLGPNQSRCCVKDAEQIVLEQSELCWHLFQFCEIQSLVKKASLDQFKHTNSPKKSNFNCRPNNDSVDCSNPGFSFFFFSFFRSNFNSRPIESSWPKYVISRTRPCFSSQRHAREAEPKQVDLFAVTQLNCYLMSVEYSILNFSTFLWLVRFHLFTLQSWLSARSGLFQNQLRFQVTQLSLSQIKVLQSHQNEAETETETDEEPICRSAKQWVEVGEGKSVSVAETLTRADINEWSQSWSWSWFQLQPKASRRLNWARSWLPRRETKVHFKLGAKVVAKVLSASSCATILV